MSKAIWNCIATPYRHSFETCILSSLFCGVLVVKVVCPVHDCLNELTLLSFCFVQSSVISNLRPSSITPAVFLMFHSLLRLDGPRSASLGLNSSLLEVLCSLIQARLRPLQIHLSESPDFPTAPLSPPYVDCLDFFLAVVITIVAFSPSFLMSLTLVPRYFRRASHPGPG